MSTPELPFKTEPWVAARKINKPQEPGMSHPHRWFKQSLDLLKLEARLARALVELDSRHAVAPWICSRHGTLQREHSQAAATGSRAAYRLPIPGLCVSYVTHSRQFFELNDGVRADLEVNSRDAHDRGARPLGIELLLR